MKENAPAGDATRGVVGDGGVFARAAAVDAERARRRAHQARRAASAGVATVDGFALRKWRRAGAFGADSVRRVEETLRLLLERADGSGAPAGAVGTLRAALGGEPSHEVPGAVKALLEHMDRETVAEVLICAHTAGTLWLTDWGEARMAALFPGGCRIPDPPSGEGVSDSHDPSGAYELSTCLAAGKADAFPARRVASVLSWAPVGVLDDLIDGRVLQAADEPWEVRQDEDEALYLRARLVPEQLGAEECERLGWVERLQRDRFLDGEDILDAAEGDLYSLLTRVADGDTKALKPLERHLPRELVLRLRRIQDGAQIGSWDTGIIADRGLWRLIVGLWEPKAAIDPRRSPLHALMALRHAYDVICSGEIRKAATQIVKLIADEDAEPAFAAEAWNMHAYLALLDDDLPRVATAQKMITTDEPGVAANLALVQRRRSIPRNDREPPSNPYLDLGLSHQSASWQQRYRGLRRDHAQDREAAARVNRAVQRIRRAEQEEDWSGFFVLPLDSDRYQLPCAVPVSLVPPPAPLQRRTTPGSAADLDAVRAQAVVDLLPSLLTTPRRPDRHTRNPV
ncbi:hypothetical protein OG422_24215 [Streptomyces sp. NBC_01525]|uniref:hypothetical protein n=1 Tax=Streptomyces sp. NBC_01525 TaxID=2903893 RepID=UPI003865BF41